MFVEFLHCCVVHDDEQVGISMDMDTSRLKKRENTKITFHDEFGSNDDKDNDEFEKDSEDFIALETDATKFKVVTKRDLNSSKFKSSEAFNFREKMLFGSRVKREPYKAQILKRDKLKVCGKAGKVGLQ